VGKKVHNIGVIVPVFNDTGALESLLRQIKDISEGLEVVVVDGGESTEARKVCGNYGAVWVSSPRGRGIQMNRGALECRGDIRLVCPCRRDHSSGLPGGDRGSHEQ